MEQNRFDLLVLGGGTVGLGVAHRAAARGWRVALVESAYLGGTCINWGCIPTKTLIQSGRVARVVQRAAAFGIHAPRPRVDWGEIRARKDQVVTSMRQGVEQGVQEADNLEWVTGEAAFVNQDTVEVGGRRLQAPRVVIATGARNLVPPIPGLSETPFLDSTSVMEAPELPDSLLILGGGIIALEYSQLLARLGVEVAILQRGPRLAPNLEPELSRALVPLLEQEGVRVVLDTEVERVEASASGVKVAGRQGSNEAAFTARALLVAAGRRSNSDKLALEKAGVNTDPRGYVLVDESFATSADGIYAAGDVTGGAMFTHRAWHDGLLLSRHLLEGTAVDSRGRSVPYAVFTDPEVAAVGWGEQQARDQGLPVEVRQVPLTAAKRALTQGEETGLLKLISRTDDGRLLGAHLLAPQAGEYVHEMVLALRLGATLQDLQDQMHIHPTLAEGLNSLALTPARG